MLDLKKNSLMQRFMFQLPENVCSFSSYYSWTPKSHSLNSLIKFHENINVNHQYAYFKFFFIGWVWNCFYITAYQIYYYLPQNVRYWYPVITSFSLSLIPMQNKILCFIMLPYKANAVKLIYIKINLITYFCLSCFN